jgi:uracil-DNA glycosylase family 4
MSCKNCPLYGQPRVEPRGEFGGLAVVGEAPGKQEVKEGKPFVGASGKLLRNSLKYFGINFEKIWVTNAVLCHPEENATPDEKTLELCRPRLLEELKKCKKVLLCGASATKTLVPNSTGILKSRGRTIMIDSLKIPATLTVHPALILRNPVFFPDFAKDVTKCLTQEYVAPLPKPLIIMCRNIHDFNSAITDLLESDWVAVDIETTDLDPFVGELILLGLQGCKERTYQIPVGLLRNRFVIESLDYLFQHTQTVGHNAASFDSRWLKHKLGIDWRPTLDTMLAHYTIDERSLDEGDKYEGLGAFGVHGLKTLAREYFNADDYDAELKTIMRKLATTRRAAIREASKQGEEIEYVAPNFGDVPRDKLSEYLAYDTLYTYLLAPILIKEMNEENTKKLHDTLLLPGALALRDVELNGVLVDPEPLYKADKEMQLTTEAYLREFKKLAEDEDFNLNSPQQVSQLFFDKLKIKKINGYSTSKEILNELKNEHPIIEKILDYRQKEKLRGTYVQGTLQRLSPDGRLRGEFLLHGTVTGRLSSRNPNLQNIPVLVGPIIRDAFIATPGWTLVEADYSQLELRIAAWYSRDEKLLQHYKKGEDVHRMVASEVFGVPPKEVTQLQRFQAKFIDFGIIYGRQAPSLAYGELQCSIAEAQKYLNSFMLKYPGLSLWIKNQEKHAKQEGFVETPVGRKRRFPFIYNRNHGEIARQSVNAPIQSLASDICLRSLTILNEQFDPNVARILLTVHDSILFEVRTPMLNDTLIQIRNVMEHTDLIESDIDFPVDIHTGKRWGMLDKRYEE